MLKINCGWTSQPCYRQVIRQRRNLSSSILFQYLYGLQAITPDSGLIIMEIKLMSEATVTPFIYSYIFSTPLHNFFYQSIDLVRGGGGSHPLNENFPSKAHWIIFQYLWVKLKNLLSFFLLLVLESWNFAWNPTHMYGLKKEGNKTVFRK